MGTNSASMAKKVIDNTYQVTAVHMMAICQAIDLLSKEEKEKLSSKTKTAYNNIRKHAAFVTDDLSQATAIKDVTDYLKENSL